MRARGSAATQLCRKDTIESVHAGTLQPFIQARRKQGIKTKSINIALGVVRHILNLAASEWLDKTLLALPNPTPLAAHHVSQLVAGRHQVADLGAVVLAELGEQQIGRASCRERV